MTLKSNSRMPRACIGGSAKCEGRRPVAPQFDVLWEPSLRRSQNLHRLDFVSTKLRHGRVVRRIYVPTLKDPNHGPKQDRDVPL